MLELVRICTRRDEGPERRPWARPTGGAATLSYVDYVGEVRQRYAVTAARAAPRCTAQARKAYGCLMA